jgi:hypothetical protein
MICLKPLDVVLILRLPTRRADGIKRDSYFYVVLPHLARASNLAAFVQFHGDVAEATRLIIVQLIS